MRISIRFVALAAALAATPALAQVDVGLGGRVGAGANVGVDTGRVVDGVRGSLDRTVDATDRTLNRTVRSDLRVATRADVRSGVAVRDSRGRRVGTVQSVHGSSAIVVQGNRRMHVPLAALYRSSNGLVTGLTSAQLRASAQGKADARADTRD
jgi:hypothetical protein